MPLAVAACLSGLERPTSAAMLPATVEEAKAAFIYNFARFTQWPESAFRTLSSPMVIGVAGDEGLRRTIDAVINNKVIGDAQVANLLKALEGQPVLTVGHDDQFCAQGGRIAFLLEGDRMRFEIRFETTQQAGLKVSSRVLTLAKAIHGKS